MGGASRNEKRRKQEEAERRLAKAGIQVPQKRNRKPQIVAVVVIAVLALVGGVVWLAGSFGGDVEPTYSTTADGAVITAGNGPVVIDVYEDYLCPSCERFEERYGNEITTALNDGKITVRFHSIAILDERSDPPGYSTRAANAAVCSVSAGIFPQYHKRAVRRAARGGRRRPDRRPAGRVRHRAGRPGRLRRRACGAARTSTR